MGSSSSRLGSRPPHPRRTKVNRTKKHRISSLICGSSSTSSSSPVDDGPEESLVNSTDVYQLVPYRPPSTMSDSVQTSEVGSCFTSSSSPGSELRASSESTITSSEHTSCVDDPCVESSSKTKCFSDSDKLVPPLQTDAQRKSNQQTLGDTVSAHCAGQFRPVGVNSGRHSISDIDGLLSNCLPQTSQDVISPGSFRHVELEGMPSFFDEIEEVRGNHNSDSGAVQVLTEPGIASQSHGDEAIQEVTPSGLRLLASDRIQAPAGGSALHVDVVSISSNTWPNNNEISTHEARRNSRRMFWDAFSSPSSRRHADIPAVVFTTEDADLMGSRRRWLLDIGEDFFDDGLGVDSWHFGRRSRVTNERRRNPRSEFWDRLRGAASENSHQNTCPFDLHPDGSCACELDEAASALSSISRIVLLAEALFEVLDEIHRQPDSFSLPMLSVPAPESVVDSLPLRTYKKPHKTDVQDDVDQCYICLVEYEEGDQIRGLPCRHEYHMSCVDKWLKEIHGICPLCRGDVRGGVKDCTASSSDA